MTGCDALNYIWQHIQGHSYPQVDLSALENVAGSASSATIDRGNLPINTVVGYKTRSGFFGKLAISSTPGATLKIQFTTYKTDGTVLASSPALSVGPNAYCDLEAGAVVSGASVSDFLWRSDEVLVPQGPAAFYLFP
jgi:hypothetical protein